MSLHYPCLQHRNFDFSFLSHVNMTICIKYEHGNITTCIIYVHVIMTTCIYSKDVYVTTCINYEYVDMTNTIDPVPSVYCAKWEQARPRYNWRRFFIDKSDRRRICTFRLSTNQSAREFLRSNHPPIKA